MKPATLDDVLRAVEVLSFAQTIVLAKVLSDTQLADVIRELEEAEASADRERAALLAAYRLGVMRIRHATRPA